RVGHRNAALRPVRIRMGRPRPQAVDHDVAAGIDSQLARPLPIGRVRIRNVQGEMIPALRIPPVDTVHTLRRAAIPLLALVPARLAPQRDAIPPPPRLSAPQQHPAPLLVPHHTIDAEAPAALPHTGSISPPHAGPASDTNTLMTFTHWGTLLALSIA